MAQIRHDAVRYRRLELRVDLAGDQGVGALGKAHVNRRKAIEGESQNVEDRVDMLLHAAAFRADGDTLTFEISDGLD